MGRSRTRDTDNRVGGGRIGPPRPRLAVCATALIATLLTGCVPAKFSGYLPSGPGTAETGYCIASIKDVLRIPVDSGVTFIIRAGENPRNQTITLSIVVNVPQGVTVQLLTPTILLQSEEWPQTRSLHIDRITGSGPKYGPGFYAPTEKLTGTADSRPHFVLWFLKGEKGTLFETGIPKVGSFSMQLPPLHINDKIYRVETVKFVAYSKWSVYLCAQ